MIFKSEDIAVSRRDYKKRDLVCQVNIDSNPIFVCGGRFPFSTYPTRQPIPGERHLRICSCHTVSNRYLVPFGQSRVPWPALPGKCRFVSVQHTNMDNVFSPERFCCCGTPHHTAKIEPDRRTDYRADSSSNLNHPKQKYLLRLA